MTPGGIADHVRCAAASRIDESERDRAEAKTESVSVVAVSYRTHR